MGHKVISADGKIKVIAETERWGECEVLRASDFHGEIQIGSAIGLPCHAGDMRIICEAALAGIRAIELANSEQQEK